MQRPPPDLALTVITSDCGASSPCVAKSGGRPFVFQSEASSFKTSESAGLKIVGRSFLSSTACAASIDPRGTSVSLISGWSLRNDSAAKSTHSYFSEP
jgi:hypothetical protein